MLSFIATLFQDAAETYGGKTPEDYLAFVFTELKSKYLIG